MFSHSIVSNLLQHHGLQHTRPLHPSPFPRVCWNSCPLSQWCCPTISSSVIHFSSCPQSFRASGSFPISLLFTSGGQRIGASASASVLPMNIQGWFPLGFTGLISLLSKGTLNHHLQHHTLKPLIHQCLAFVMVQLSHPLHHYWKNHSFDYMDLCCKVMSLLFNTLSRSVIAFLPRSKHLLILHGIAKQNSKKWNISEIFYFPHLLPKKSFPQSMGFSRQEC